MRWQDEPTSSNVEDRRGMGPAFAGGGVLVIIIIVVALLMGKDPREVLNSINAGGADAPADSSQPPQPRADDPLAAFSSHTLGETERVWGEVFAEHGKQYEPPKLVLYDGATSAACGFAQSAMGPFYCPLDQKVYVDLAFYRELKEKYGAPGDFAQAYVIAHEVGHHVQTLLGITEKVQAAEQAQGAEGPTGLSVRNELQADCFAGVWANRANARDHILEAGDIDDGIRAAASVGDDRLQKANRGEVEPDSFTHGTSAQRSRWFKQGFASGRIESCDTFSASADSL